MAGSLLIRKEIIRLHASDEQLALRLQRLFKDKLQHDLQEMMERVFDQASTSELYINIDKLSLDLGVLQADVFEQQFVKEVEPKLANELRRQLQDYLEPINDADQLRRFYDDTPVAAPSLQLNSAGEQRLNALLFFLENGIYPWWYQNENPQAPEALLEMMMANQAENLILRIISFKNSKTNQTFQNILSRLFTYLDELKYLEIINILVKLYNDQRLIQNTEAIISHVEEITESILVKGSIPLKKFHQTLFKFILTHASDSNENFIYHFLKYLVNQNNSSFPTLNNGPKVSLGASDFEAALLKIIKEFGDKAALQKKGSPQGDLPKKGNPDLEAAKEGGDAIQQPNPIPEEKKPATPEILEAIYIHNAGLVLLHPFLPAFFAEAGLLSKKHIFLSGEAQQKAAVLLYYMQSGEAQYKEWEMPFNKILCGFDHREVLAEGIVITDTDKQNCEQLLRAVVNHWEALKGASIQALQNTFLLHEGKISWKECFWLIQVERSGADILLDKLPWGYSTIKFPWLENIIHTEW
ncbi:MAG: contractile injection system tape measure protein [Anditalea sp.]